MTQPAAKKRALGIEPSMLDQIESSFSLGTMACNSKANITCKRRDFHRYSPRSPSEQGDSAPQLADRGKKHWTK